MAKRIARSSMAYHITVCKEIGKPLFSMLMEHKLLLLPKSQRCQTYTLKKRLS